jgi:hypothetical protein
MGAAGRKIKMGEVVNEEGIKDKDTLSQILGIVLTDVEYGKLRDMVKYVRGKFKPIWEMKEKGKNIQEWVAGIKKGSNKLRQLMSGRGSRAYRQFSFENIRPIKTLWDHLGLQMDENLLMYGVSLWNIKEVDTEFRQFCFKWNQGMIHGNTVISHFGENVDRKCTFCKIRAREGLTQQLGRDPTEAEMAREIISDENRQHIFWDCATVSRVCKEVYKGVWGTNIDPEKKDFLMGKAIICAEVTQLYMVVNNFIRYRLWKYKIAGAIPLVNSIINDTNNLVTRLCYYNKWRIMLPLLRQHVRE